MKIIKPDTGYDALSADTTVFLAGSIEMGVAEDWQSMVPKHFEDKTNLVFYNPRRDDWDSSWEQKESNPQFNHQVNWELDKLDKANYIFMYFSPETKSPISLLELGMFVSKYKMIVCCPDGFWRKGNVEIVCSRFNIPLFNTLDGAIGRLKTYLRNVDSPRTRLF
jgi:hypothetical protein